MKISSNFTFDSVVFDKDNDAHLVIAITAPALEGKEKRPRVCVIPCIDISGSMAGSKLDYAKKAALKLVDQLSPTDYAGLVTFSDQGRVDFAPCEMTSPRKDALKAVIGKIRIEGGTNFSDGMLKALDAAKRLDLGGSTITRVIMLTDGQPTHGIAMDSKSLDTLLGASRGHATLSAFGFGHDPNQDLLSSLASVGQGNYAFIQDPDNALAAFGKELGGLLSTYAQSVVVDVTPTNGHLVSEVLSDVETEEEVDGEVSMKIPSILAEETSNLVLSVKLATQKQGGPRQVNAFNVKVTYQRLGDDGGLVTETVESKAKVQFVKAGDEQKVPTKEVDEVVARAQLVKTQLEAEKAAQRGDFSGANVAFESALNSFNSRGHVGLAAAAGHINGLYADLRSYSANSGRRTALRNATSRGTGVSMREEDASVLLSASYSMTTPSQDLMTQSFSADLQAPAPAPAVVGVPVDPFPMISLSSSRVDQGSVPAWPTLLTTTSGGAGGFAQANPAHVTQAFYSGITSPQVAQPPTPPAAEAKPASKKKVSKAKSKRW